MSTKSSSIHGRNEVKMEGEKRKDVESESTHVTLNVKGQVRFDC